MLRNNKIINCGFIGFSEKSFNFLGELAKHNSLLWLKKNKDEFNNLIINPAKQLITDIAEFINFINPAIRTEPKFDKTIMRIYKDQRFAKSDPLRDFILIHFGRYKMDSEFYVYFNQNSFEMGVFINLGDPNCNFSDNIKKHNLIFIDMFNHQKLNNRLDLQRLGKTSVVLRKKFNPAKDSIIIEKEKMVLFSISYDIKSKIISSKRLSVEVLKRFIQLYPLLIFAYHSNPLPELESYYDKIAR